MTFLIVSNFPHLCPCLALLCLFWVPVQALWYLSWFWSVNKSCKWLKLGDLPPLRSSLLYSGLRHCKALFNLLLISIQGYAPACHCDGLVEVVGLQGVMHLVRKTKFLTVQEWFFRCSTSLDIFQHYPQVTNISFTSICNEYNLNILAFYHDCVLWLAILYSLYSVVDI